MPLALKPSAGQPAAAPEQASARSQSPLAARQVVPLALKLSAGHCPLVPLQASA